MILLLYYRMKENPLVSVVVATYNSAETVLETLDSVKAQTYSNLELIISDDGSKDLSVSICEKWLKENGDSFIFARIITSEYNTGISPNMNRGIRNTHGSWIKIIAADDRLLPECVSSYVTFVNDNPQFDIVFSKIIGFGDEDAARNYIWKDCSKVFENFSRYEFKTVLYQRNFLPASSAFIKKETFDELGGYDESIPYLEDWPFWVKAIDKGYGLGFFNDYTVEYRFSSHSISQINGQQSSDLYRTSCALASTFALNHLSKMDIFSWFYKITTYNSLECKSTMWKFIHYLNVFNPFYYHNKKTLKRFYSFLT